MTPQEWTKKTVKDISATRKRRAEGKRQAQDYTFENILKIQRRINK
jgi:hypothetical protein